MCFTYSDEISLCILTHVQKLGKCELFVGKMNNSYQDRKYIQDAYKKLNNDYGHAAMVEEAIIYAPCTVLFCIDLIDAPGECALVNFVLQCYVVIIIIIVIILIIIIIIAITIIIIIIIIVIIIIIIIIIIVVVVVVVVIVAIVVFIVVVVVVVVLIINKSSKTHIHFIF